MPYYRWGSDKNERLSRERGISFEEVVFHIERGDWLDILEHRDQGRYPGQRIFVITVDGYVCLVPFVESENEVLLKTIIPSREATRQYLGDK